MSYSIALWDPSRYQPLPTTFDEAAAIYRKLADVHDEANYWFVAFAQRIQDHVRLSPDPDETLIGYYGNFVATAQAHTGALFLVELPTEDRIPLLRLMVDTATALKLVVYDDASGLVFLPGGKVLPEEKSGVWQDVKAELDRPSEFPRTKAKFKKLAEPILAELFCNHGFKKGGDWDGEPVLVRELMGGVKQYAVLSYESPRFGGAGYRLAVQMHVAFEPVNAIYERFNFNFYNRGCVFGISLSTLCGWVEQEDSVSSWSQFGALLSVVEREVIGLFDIAKDIHGMHAVMNGNAAVRLKEDMRKTIYIPHCLIVAKLVGASNFSDLTAELSEAVKKFWRGPDYDVRCDEFARLVKYLREEVNPLV